MSTATVTPPVPVELQAQDPTLDRLYGLPATEPRTTKAPPISRSMQFVEDFAPPVPAELQPVTPPTQVPPTTQTATPPVPEPVPTTAPAPAPVVQPTTVDQQPHPVKVFRVVDLQDGSGVQRFEAEGPTLEKAYEALADKLTQAQTHASRYIKTLKEKAKAKPDLGQQEQPLQYQPRDLTDADITALNETYKTNPVKAWMEMYEALTGTKPNAVAKAVFEAQIAEAKEKAGRAEVEFINAHQEDFDCSPESGQKIYSFLAGCTRPVTDGGYQCPRCHKVHDPAMKVTLNNLEYAFETLTEQGHVFTKKPVVAPEPAPAPVAPPVQVAPPPPAPVPAPPAPVVQPVAPQVQAPPPPVMLSDRSGQRTVTAPESEGVNAAALSSLPIGEMRARIGQLLKAGAVPSR